MTAGDSTSIAAQLSASLLGIAQWALLAWALQGIADHEGVVPAAWAAGGLVFVATVRSALDAWGKRRAFRCARERLSSCRSQALDNTLRTSPLDATRPHSGRVAHALAEQAEALVPYLSRVHVASWRARIVPLAILAVVAVYSWMAALVLVLAAPVVPLFMALIGARAQSASAAQMAEAGDLSGSLLDRLRGLPTLRALGAIEHAAARLQRQSTRLHQLTMAVLRIAFMSTAVIELFASLGVAMVAVYVGFHLLGDVGFGAWGGRLSLAEGAFILMLAPAYFEPLRELGSVWHDRAAGRAALEELDKIALPGAPLAASPFPVRRPSSGGGDSLAACGVRIELHDLHFTHAGSRDPCIDRFSASIASGERIALVGANGSGKSTLLALMAGLTVPARGSVTIDGLAWRDDTAERQRSRIGWMGQRPAFLARSVHANVALGRDSIGGAEVGNALRKTALAGVISAASSVGEQGLGLCGGEARRLALGRALADPSCGLILADEPTANLDAATSRELIDCLLGAAKGRTLVVATHDPELIRRMDRVISIASEARAQAPASEAVA